MVRYHHSNQGASSRNQIATLPLPLQSQLSLWNERRKRQTKSDLLHRQTCNWSDAYGEVVRLFAFLFSGPVLVLIYFELEGIDRRGPVILTRFRPSRVSVGHTHLSAKRDRNCFPQSSLEARPSKRSLSGVPATGFSSKENLSSERPIA